MIPPPVLGTERFEENKLDHALYCITLCYIQVYCMYCKEEENHSSMLKKEDEENNSFVDAFVDAEGES